MTTLDSDLASGPPLDDDDLEADPIPVRYRRRWPLLTAILALGVFAAIAFIGGVEIQKHYGGSSSASTRRRRRGAFARLRGGTTTTGGHDGNGVAGGGFSAAPARAASAARPEP